MGKLLKIRNHAASIEPAASEVLFDLERSGRALARFDMIAEAKAAIWAQRDGIIINCSHIVSKLDVLLNPFKDGGDRQRGTITYLNYDEVGHIEAYIVQVDQAVSRLWRSIDALVHCRDRMQRAQGLEIASKAKHTVVDPARRMRNLLVKTTRAMDLMTLSEDDRVIINQIDYDDTEGSEDEGARPSSRPGLRERLGLVHMRRL